MKLADITPGYYLYHAFGGYAILEADIDDTGTVIEFNFGSELFGKMSEETAAAIFCKIDIGRIIQETEKEQRSNRD